MVTHLQKNGLKRLSSERGGVLVAAGLALPIIVVGILYTLDSCRLLNQRMNLLHAGDEASLAIATTGNENKTAAEKEANKKFVTDYLKLYLPDATEFPVIQIETELDTVNNTIIYDISAKAKFDTYLPTSDKTISLPYGGRARQATSGAADFVFAVDVSWGPENSFLSDEVSYVKASKIVIPELAALALAQNKDNRVAIMPNDVAIPVKMRDGTGKLLTNERGGPVMGCGNLFVPTPAYDITYGFWSQQPFYNSPTAKDGGAGSYYKRNDLNYNDFVKTGNFNHLTYAMDKLRYEYYMNYVLRSINQSTLKQQFLGVSGTDVAAGHMAMDLLANNQIPELWGKVRCDKNPQFIFDPKLTLVNSDRKYEAKNRETGRYKYSCYTLDDHYSNIFSPENLHIIKNEYHKLAEIRDMQDEYASLIHGLSIDYEKTVNQLFTLEPIMMKFNWGNRGSGRFNQDYIDHARRDPTFRPFNEVCHSIGFWAHRDRYSGEPIGSDRSKDKNSSLEASRLVPRNYLIDFTDSKTKTDEFKQSQSFGHKHSGHALMYATYLAKKGKNPNKVIVVFGLRFDETWGPNSDNNSTRAVTKKLFTDYKLCQKIKEGFKKFDPKVKNVNIYYVSLYRDGDSQEGKKYWEENCVGAGNAFFLIKSNGKIDDDEVKRLKEVVKIKGGEAGSFA